MKKYEFTNKARTIRDDNGIFHTVYQIRALKDFGDVHKGDLGGWLEKESNLSHEGTCWVSDYATVCGEAYVCGNARVSDDAQVYGNASVYAEALIEGTTKVYGNARVYGAARVSDDAQVHGNARVYGTAWIVGDASIHN